MILLLIIAISTLLDPPPLEMNSASEEELRRLDGIGSATASAIVEYRNTVSSFASLEELIFVPGISIATLEHLLPYIAVSDGDVPRDTAHFMPGVLSSDTLLTVVFLDVGNGDAILIDTDESSWLIDAGPPGEGALRAPVVQRLIDCGVDSISVLAFTHPHADHIGGCRDVLDVFNCNVLYDPGIDFASPLYEELLQYAFDSECSYSTLSGNDRWQISEKVLLEVVWLERGAGSPNEASAVYKVTCGEFTLLITGDIEIETVMCLTACQTPVTVMKVPHHGSRSSLFPPWFRRAAPQFAVFCCGRNNPFGHPHRDVLDAWITGGAEILRTDSQGDIFLYTDGESVDYQSSLLH